MSKAEYVERVIGRVVREARFYTTRCQKRKDSALCVILARPSKRLERRGLTILDGEIIPGRGLETSEVYRPRVVIFLKDVVYLASSSPGLFLSCL